MKYAFVLSVILACSLAAMEPSQALATATSKFAKLAKATPAKLTEEDVKFCGTYSTGCVTDSISSKADMTILGMMHKNPIYVQYPITLFGGNTCSEDISLMTMTMNAPMKVKNGIEKDVVLTPEKYTVIFKNQVVIDQYTCTTPLELNVEYDVTTLDCKDDEGEDPFEITKSMIGQDIEAPFVFGENQIVIKEGDDEMTLTRESDVGCTCAVKKANAAMTSLAKAAPVKIINEEDVKFCGSYSTGCASSPLMSMNLDMTILGMMHKNPIYLQYPVSVFAGAECTEEAAMMTMTMNAPMKAKNGIEKTMTITPEKYTVVFKNEAVFADYTCSSPLEVNVEYDISTLECKDKEGEDPFADTKAMIGQDMDTPFVFGENEVVIKDEEGNDITLNRQSDVGCTCARKLRD